MTIIGDRNGIVKSVISAALANKLMRQECKAYLTHVVEVDKSKSDGKIIPTVS